MKLISILAPGLLSLPILAETIVTSTGNKKDNEVIILEHGRGEVKRGSNVFVESGTSSLTGAPEERVKAAYASWENRCKEWKNELRQLNKTNLLVADCGQPKRKQESQQSEKLYTYESTATYKIRISENK